MGDNNAEIIGGVAVTVEADLSDLQSGFDSAVATATRAGQDIASALTAASDTTSTDALTQSLQSVGDAAETAGSQMAALADGPQTLAEYYDELEAAALSASSATEQVGNTAASTASSLSEASGAAQEATASHLDLAEVLQHLQESITDLSSRIDELGDSVKKAAQHAEEARSGFAGLAEGLGQVAEALVVTEGLREFAAEALTVYGNIQKVSIALTALTGSAETAEAMLAVLKGLAVTDALSFPSLVSAAQRMTAFGIATDRIPALLDAAANAGEAGGRGFDAASNALLRMSAAGTVSGRMLVTLGLNTNDLGKAMGVASTEVSKAFKELDQSGRLDVLSSALEKFGGLAHKEADTIPGEWQNVKTQFEFVMEGIGEALAPAASAIMSFAVETVIPAVKDAVDSFNELPGPVKASLVVIAGIVGVAAPAALAIKGLISTFEALSTIKTAITAVTTALATVTGTEAAAVSADAVATAADTTALEANTVAQVANTAAKVAGAEAAGASAVASGAAAAGAGAAAAATTGATAATGAWAAATTLGATVATAASAAIGILSLGVIAVKLNDQAATGAQETWTDALLHFIGVLSDADIQTKALGKDTEGLTADVRKGIDAISLVGQKLRDADTSYRQVASAARFAADAIEAHRIRAGLLNAELDSAKVHLQQVSDDFHAGKASAEDLAVALDDVTKATNALKEPMSAAAKAADSMAARMENFRLRIAELPAIIATVSSATEVASAETKAHAEAISYSVSKLLALKTALVQAQAAYESHRGSLEAVLRAEEKVATEQAFLNKLVGEAPKWDAVQAALMAAELGKVASGIASVVDQLPALQPFTQTLEQIDAEWVKQSEHVNKLAKYDVPAAIQTYTNYITKLQSVAAPIGQIYDAEEKLLQLEINAASQRGQDATAQIIQLTNLKEKTEALQTASQNLGQVYAGFVHTFDDAFTELGSQLTDATVHAQTFGQAFHNVVKKIESDIVGTLINGALKELKAAIVNLLSGSGTGSGLFGALGKLAGGGSGGSAAVQMQAAVTQFHAAVTQFGASDAQLHAAVTQFQAGVTQFHTAVATLEAAATTFDEATTFFDETTGIFDESVGTFDAATAFFDESTTFFDESAAFFDESTVGFDASTVAFGTAVAAFGVAVATMGAGGGIFGLLSIFAMKGGGEVGDVPILSYLHPKEMVLPADLTSGIKNIIASGSTNMGGLGSSTININSGTLPNLSGFTDAVNGFTDATASSSRSEAPASPVSTTPSVSVSVPQAPSPRIAVPSIQAPESSSPKSPAPRTEPEPSISSVTASAFRTSVGDFAEIAGSLGKLPVAVTNFKTTTDSFTDRLSDFGSKMGKAGATSTAESGTSFSSPGLSGAVGLRLYAFEGGGDVPGNVLALLHAQEMVLPAPLAQGLRNLFAQGAFLGQSSKLNLPQNTEIQTQATKVQAAPQPADSAKKPDNPFVDFGTIMGSGINALIGSLTGHAPKNAGPDVTVSVPSNSLALPSVPSSASSFALPSTGESSVSQNSERAVFENCVFNGVTQTMVNEIMNKVVQATRRAGSRF